MARSGARLDVRGGTPAADRRVDLRHHAVDRVTERRRLWASPRVRRRHDAIAERPEERLDFGLLGDALLQFGQIRGFGIWS